APRNMPTQRKAPQNMPTQRKAPPNMPTQRKAPRARKLGSAISQLIVQTIAASNDRSGMALPTLKKVLAATGYDVKKNQDRVRVAVKSLVKKGVLVQTRGFGASAAYKINDTRVRLPSKRRTSRTARPKAKRGVGRKAPRNMPTQRNGAPKHAHTKEGAPKHAHTEEGAPKHAHTEEGAPKHAHTKEGAPKHAHTEEGAPKHAHTEEGAPKHAHTEEGAPKHAHTEEGATKHA
uniref:Zgc:110425 n=1 Tax=Tetraodon nigroviridis TaxID=99883 RepID=H3BYQ8_TETNG